jgi:hypothetical protein
LHVLNLIMPYNNANSDKTFQSGAQIIYVVTCRI